MPAASQSRRSPRRDELTIRDPAVLETLFDPLRYRMFRALAVPRSIPEVAEQVGTSANRLYYHLRRLLEAGLVVQVDARASGNHTERVYAQAAKRMALGGDVPIDQAASGVGAILDEANREVGVALRALEAGEFGKSPAGAFAWHTAALTEAQARAFERRVDELVSEFSAAEKASRGRRATRRYALLGVFTPLPERRTR